MLDKYTRDIEAKWHAKWDELGVHKFEPDAKGPIYSIDTPPPFTSGDLHMGHVLSYSYFDFVARYKRMKGFNVFYPQGWDCQGFPTEVKVEAKFGKGLKPEEFRKHCVEWTHKYIERMREQMKSVGFSPDWRHEYRTMDAEYWKKVQLSLIMMHEKGLVYRGEHPVFWCTSCGSAIAKAEIDDLERDNVINHVHFKIAGGASDADRITIATTRPELFHACAAILVHPEDEKYKNLVGKEAIVPIFGQKVKIIADADVDKEFGTGAVMVCTFGDKTDVVWTYRHNLKIVRTMEDKGRLMNAGEFTGKKGEEARKEIIEKLKASGELEKQLPLRQVVKVHDRCSKPVEMMLSRQWFAKIKGNEQRIIDAAKSMKWVPEFTIQYLIDWANFIEWDWVISRQRVFGTPLPFWNCEKCGKEFSAAKEELPVDPHLLGERKCPHCGGNAKPETSTCDCWIDSSISPLVIAGWPDGKDFSKLFPASLRPQGTEIIRTWAFYTIYRSLMLTGKAPFKELLLNGNVLAPDGKKMSKSLGNVVVPDELLKKYSADAVRQWVALSGALARDRPFRHEDIQHAQTFINKVWNASKFVEKSLEGYEPKPEDAKHLRSADKWILSRLSRVMQACEQGYENFDFHIAMNGLHEFVWHEFCDYYLEYVKHRLYSPETYGEDSKRAAQHTLHTVLYAVLRAFFPIAPHVSEEIYQHVFAQREGHASLATAPFPQADAKAVSEEAEKLGALMNRVTADARRWKNEHKLPLNAELASVSVSVPKGEARITKDAEEDLLGTVRGRKLIITEGDFGVECA